MKTFPVALAVALAATLTAQSQTPQTQTPTTQTPTTQTPQRGGAGGDQRTTATGQNTMTWTGCVARGSGATDQYVLNNAMSSPGRPSTGATGTAGNTGATSATGTPAGSKEMSYVLAGRDSEIAKHVGHRVEIVGTMSNTSATSGARGGAAGTDRSSGGATGGGDRTGAGAAGGADRSGAPPAAAGQSAGRIQVTSVRMLSESCS